MDWVQIREQLLKATGYDLEISGAFGKSKTITLTIWPDSPFALTFKTLGSGSMKRVVRVEGEDWVLAMAGDSPAALTDMQGEVRTLLEIRDHIRVPEPFASSNEGQILFKLKKVVNIDSGDDKEYPAFLQQFLPYQEMDKLKKREDFAKDFILNLGVPGTIQTTVDDLKKILGRLKAHEWGDFQVMYQQATGYVYVFDPLPENQSGVSSVPVVEKWLADIEAARKK